MSDQPQPNLRMIGHDALRIALDHERHALTVALQKEAWRKERSEAGSHWTPLDDEERTVTRERFERAKAFADWAMDEFRRTYGSEAS